MLRAATTTRGGDASYHRGAQRGCALPPRHTMAHRAATNARHGPSCGHQGSYRGRGCPESPHLSMHLPPPRWRCRPARPPTSRNPALRAAPPRSFRTRLIVHRPPIPTPMRPQKPPIPTRLRPRHDRFAPRCVHKNRRSPPVCGTTTIVSHPDDRPLTIASHRVAPTKIADPHPDEPAKPPIPTPMLTAISRLNAALSNELGINSQLQTLSDRVAIVTSLILILGV
jgi:hypothetical protein